jgi:hypothetical protein
MFYSLNAGTDAPYQRGRDRREREKRLGSRRSACHHAQGLRMRVGLLLINTG